MTTEQLWARRVGDRQFQVCCIPFASYELALGDVVETDDDYPVIGVLQVSGRYEFRVFFTQPNIPQKELNERLDEMGGQVERSSPNLIAVDAADEDHARLVASFLQGRERLGQIAYETGKTNW